MQKENIPKLQYNTKRTWITTTKFHYCSKKKMSK